MGEKVRSSGRYTQTERKEAVFLARKIGRSRASAQLGIPNGTISCWMHRYRNIASPNAEKRETETSSKRTQANKGRRKKRVAKIYTPSQRAEILEYSALHGPTEASRKFGASRWTIYAWEKKVARAAKGKGASPTSGPNPEDIRTKRDREILDEWQRQPGLGPSQIKNQLRRQNIKISTNTVRQVMEDAGYRPPKVKRSKHDQRYEAIRPNQAWHLDFLQRYINRASTFSLILLDDFSRFTVGFGVDDAERADMVLHTFEAAVERHGKPEMVIHDKGSAFWAWNGISRYTKLLEEMNIEQVAGTKQTNGKLEVFNGNLQKELFDVHHFYDLAEMKRRLGAHLHWYNHRRTHHALGGLLVPADRYYGRVEEVLARIEAGAGASAHTDQLDLRDRELELFKVVSRDGKPEVWLMGQPLLTSPTEHRSSQIPGKRS